MHRSIVHLMKRTTKITGLLVEPNALPHLSATYHATLSALSHFPPSHAYRQAVEALTTQRVGIVDTLIDRYHLGSDGRSQRGADHERESQGDIAVAEFEKRFNEAEGDHNVQIEQVLETARRELQLVGKMVEWKAWEPLQVPTPEGQWKSPFKLDD